MCRWQGLFLPIQDFHKVELNVSRGGERIPLLFYDAFCFRVRDDISCGYVSVWGQGMKLLFHLASIRGSSESLIDGQKERMRKETTCVNNLIPRKA